MTTRSESSSSAESAVNEVIAQFLMADQAGKSPDVAELIARYPEHASQLQSFFDNYRRFRQFHPVDAAVSDTSQPDIRQTSHHGERRELPRRFGRYRIGKLLGHGGMGAVYLAEDTELKRQVALKIPNLSGAAAPDVLRRFQREAHAAARLSHPHICPVYDVGEIDGHPFLTMKLIDGVPLTRYVRGTKLPPQRSTAKVVLRLASALAEAHQQGIVHRDLKPANVMIDRRGEPILMDFGLARLTREDDLRVTQTGVILGSPAYMSPEHLSGRSEAIGPQADVYSLGVLFYEMLTGKLPFTGNVTQVIAQILHTPAPAPSLLQPEIVPELDRLCVQMLDKSPELRPLGMPAVQSALSAWLHPTSSATRRSPDSAPAVEVQRAGPTGEDAAPSQFVGLTRNHRWTVVALSALTVIGLATLGIFQFGRQPEPERAVTATPSALETIAAPTVTPVPAVVTEPIGPADPPADEEPAAPVSAWEAVMAAAVPLPVVAPPPPTIPPPDPAYFGIPAGDERNDNGLGMAFGWCPPGEFLMGSPPGEPGRDSHEHPVHVRLSNGFWMGKYEVTQEEWLRVTHVRAIDKAQQVIAADPDAKKIMASLKIEGIFGEGDRHPMKFVPRIDAELFCQRLTDDERRAGRLPDGWEYRLPTEAEWEYACRAGTTTATAFGPNLGTHQAAIPRSYNRRPLQLDRKRITKEVGSFRPNDWGLYDMHGNVAEWVQDWYQPQLPGGVDPMVVSAGQQQMYLLRGGAVSVFEDSAKSYDDCRSAARLTFDPAQPALSAVGFRVVIGPILQSRPDVAQSWIARERELAKRLIASAGIEQVVLRTAEDKTLSRHHNDQQPLPVGPVFVERVNWNQPGFDRELLGQLAKLKYLNSLEFQDCDFGDADVSLLLPMQQLQSLSVINCPLTDTGLVQLSRHRKISGLRLNKTQVTVRGLTALRQLAGLRYLVVGESVLTDEGIARVVELPVLRLLGVYSPTDETLVRLGAALPRFEEFMIVAPEQFTASTIRSLLKMPNLKGFTVSNDDGPLLTLDSVTVGALLQFVQLRTGRITITGKFQIKRTEHQRLTAVPNRFLLGVTVLPDE